MPEETLKYVIVQRGQCIICFTCGFMSHHPRDVKERYCGICRVFHDDAPHTERLRGVDRSATGREEAA